MAILPLNSFCQVSDNFSDGDFISNPIWVADHAGNWTISAGQLRSNSLTPNSTFYIATPSTIATMAQWNFLIHLPFNTSGANYVDVYLVSQQQNLTSASNNGYFVRIGGTSDEVGLWKLTSGVSTPLIDGVNGITNTSNNLIRISVTRDASNLWTLNRDVGNTGSFITEGTTTDATFLSSAFFGIRITQSTASFHTKHYFDDFYVGTLISDSEPPSLSNVHPISEKELELVFSEKLDRLSAEENNHYSVNNGVGVAQQATLQEDEKTVRLLFAVEFPNADTSLVTINNVADLLGNTMTVEERKFFSFRPVAAIFNDIIISEIFADPSPSIGLPEAEFLEIYNRSTKAFDLGGWKIIDASTEKTLPSKIIFPDDYVVLVNSSSASLFEGYKNVVPVPGFPTLTNTGEWLVLKDNSGLLIDSVRYDDDWYGDEDKKTGGYSLERISPESVCIEEERNWTTSQHISGGTPGSKNSVFSLQPDSLGPTVISVQVLSTSQVKVLFSEALKGEKPTADQFVLTPLVEIGTALFIDSTLTEITLNFLTELKLSVVYTLTVSGVEDCSGNAIPINSKAMFVLPEKALAKDVIITEIFADPSPSIGLPEAEFFEIYNRSEKIIDLKDWSVSDEGTQGIFSSQLLMPGHYAVVSNPAEVGLFTRYGTVARVNKFPTLNNAGDYLVLRNSGHEIIDSIAFDVSWYKNDEKELGGWTLELIDITNTCGEVGNWIASEDESGGTPGRDNSVKGSKPDTTPPQLENVSISGNDQLKLLFNEKLEKRAPARESFVLTPPLEIAEVCFTSPSLTEVALNLTSSLAEETLYTLRVRSLKDCAGNEINSVEAIKVFALPQQAEPGDILINEILFNPRPFGADFIEVYNNSKKYINLKTLALANSEKGVPINIRALSGTDMLFYPGTYLVLSEDVDNIQTEYPKSSTYTFLETNIPSMGDDEGSLVLLTDRQMMLDSLVYSSDMHSPLIKSEDGVSLERVSLTETSQVYDNWKSGVASSNFATPGYVNANALQQSNGQEEVHVEPEVFEPVTGQPNFASIHYNFDRPGLVANAKIMDAQGRVIKKMVNNEVLASVGFFTWDGDQDDGTRARIGYYTLWMEVFDTSGFVKTFRKRIVIASRF